METAPTVNIRGTRNTGPLEAYTLEHLEKLQRYSASVTGARVLVEPADRRHRDGSRYHVRIDLTVPGEEIVITHDASPRSGARQRAARALRKSDELERTHRRASVAIREAFEHARRRLQDYERRRRGQVKTHTGRRKG
jgi:hypothetical protein